MQNMLNIIFWVSFIILFWIFIGYPLSLLLVSIKKKESSCAKSEPFVSLIVPTYNESAVIEDKIKNVQKLDYPKEKIELIVVDSNSSDNTVDKAKKYYPDLKVVSFNYRMGKARAINDILPLVKGEYVVITDANAFMDKNVLKEVMAKFDDPRIGAVTGAMRQVNRTFNAVAEGGDVYWKMEVFMRKREEQLHSVIAMSGEISAFRKSIFVKDNKVVDWYKPGGTDDFEMTLWVIKHGYKVAYAPKANVWEYAPDTISDLFKQKVRIIVQTIISVSRNLNIIFHSGIYGPYIFISRKLLPLFSPWLLILIFISSLMLASRSTFWLIVALLQIAFYLLGMASFSFLKNFKISKLTQFFILLNATVLIAWVKYIMGKDYTRWEALKSTRRL